MKKIVILNPKGGSGKSTIAVNLAAYYAANELKTALMDHDSQGSSVHWLSKRTDDQPQIHPIRASRPCVGATRSWQLRTPVGTERLIVDTPAALDLQSLPQVTQGADAILVPVLPSNIDIHAASECIATLVRVTNLNPRINRIGVIANRIRKNTLVYQDLMRFLSSLSIPVVARLRDSQNYVRGGDQGKGIHEMPASRVRKDLSQWSSMIDWLENRPAHQLSSDYAAPVSAHNGAARPSQLSSRPVTAS